MIIECTDVRHIIKILVESTKGKTEFLGDFNTYCYNKKNRNEISINYLFCINEYKFMCSK